MLKSIRQNDVTIEIRTLFDDDAKMNLIDQIYVMIHVLKSLVDDFPHVEFFD